MAEVLPPQSGPITMLHTSPDPFQNASAQSHSPSPRLAAMPRTHVYNAPNNGMGYRGPIAAPVAPYAFQSTPHLRQDNRTTSAPGGSLVSAGQNIHARSGQSNASSISTNASTTSSASSRSQAGASLMSKDDFSISLGTQKSVRLDARPVSAINMSASVPDLTLTLPPTLSPAAEPTPKASPNRYRRPQQQRNESNTQSPRLSPQPDMGTTGNASPQRAAGNVAKPSLSPFDNTSRPGHARTTSADESNSRTALSEQAKRYRRRSVGSIDPSVGAAPLTSSVSASASTFSPPANNDLFTFRPAPVLERPVSAGQMSRTREPVHFDVPPQRPSSERRESSHSAKPQAAKPQAANPAQRPSSPLARVNGRSPSPVRAAETGKRPVKPSPLSKPISVDTDLQDENSGKPSFDSETDAPAPPSPAVQHLAALSDKDLNKGRKSSRLRRAFSFGSSAELRKASAHNNVERERAKLTKEPSETERQQAELAATVAKQEAAGLGNSIYSQGQGGVFSSSTDNLSISSTASSASLMLRKMGKGMKKSARSVKGLFRPKSVIGVPAADGPVGHSTAEVSMVNVEAERERVNVNAYPDDRTGGGTGFPHLERNSLDAGSAADSFHTNMSSDIRSRKSIVGSDNERDEVLKAVRKGILKRTGTGASSINSSPVNAPTDGQDLILPPVPHILDSPLTGTPTEENGPTKSNSFPTTGVRPDYFNNANRVMNGSSRSLPSTPNGTPRNISFNPRIQFHDAWSSNDYDRRGDIATCNRLTPMLAQQIKEELNTFKMEMEVHELSKPHTHFF